MNIYKITVLIALFLNTNTFGQKFPKDALDSNTVFIFSPTASVDDNKETFDYFTQNIIDSGFNLVGKHIYSQSLVSLKEIEFDIKNKDVKYIFLLTYSFYKEANYQLFFFENNEKNKADLIEPEDVIIRIRRAAIIATAAETRPSMIKKLNKEIATLTEEYPNINKEAYDDSLVNDLILTKEDIQYLTDLNNKNTLIDGATLSIEHKEAPADLSSNELAVIGLSIEEYRSSKLLNMILKSKIKNYPYKYTYFPDYDSYLNKGGDQSFKYRLQLTKSSVSFISEGKNRQNYTAFDKSKLSDLQSGSTPDRQRAINYEKDLFTVIIKDNTTGKRYKSSERDFIGQALKYFVSQF